MPHQCLKCGQLFNEGSTIILRGCPECRGTRFFYTQSPLTMSEREKLLATSEVSLREAIDNLVKNVKETGDVPATDSQERLHLEAPPIPVRFIPAPPKTPPGRELWEPASEPVPVALPGEKLKVKLPPESRRPAKLSRQRGWDYVAPPEPEAAPPVAAAAPPAPVAPVAAPEEPKTVQSDLVQFAPTQEPAPPLPGIDVPETIRIQGPGEYEIDVKRLLEDSPVVIQRDGTYLIHLASLFASTGRRQS